MELFYLSDLPIASSMIELAGQAEHPFQKYFCYWAAFNNIYTVIGKRYGLLPEQRQDRGSLLTEPIWTYIFPSIKVPSGSKLIKKTVEQLDERTKSKLIEHPNVKWFIDRVPVGSLGRIDRLGQVINGVLNITRTIEPDIYVWSPINETIYNDCINGDLTYQQDLSEQIVFVLYTIRNNLVHGHKSISNDNDLRVVRKGLPILKDLVESFFYETRSS
jgi:hypothetical protein